MSVLHARLVAYEPNGAMLGLLPEPSSWDASFLHNDIGALQIQYSRHALGGDILKRGLEQGLEIAVQVGSDTTKWVEPDNGRFILTKRTRNALDDSDTVTLSLPSYSWLFNKMLNMDTGHLVQDGDNKGKRAFLSSTPGTILRTLMQENWSKYGVWDIANVGFDTAKDSAGASWAKVYTLYYSLGTSLNSIVSSFVGGSAFDWRVAGRKLKVWNADSTALCRQLDDSIVLQFRTDVSDAPEEETIEELASDVLVTGDNGLVFEKRNTAAPTPWGRWQSYYSQGGVSDKGTAESFMQAQLELASRVRGQYTRSVLLSDVESLPLLDYHPGDWITAPTVNHGEKVRVQQITLSVDESGNLSASLTLNDKFYDSSIRQYKRIVGITGGAKLAGSENGTTNTGNDHRVPKAPEGLVVSSDAYLDSNGYARGVVYAVWGEVAYATDGTVIDVSGYRAQWRYEGESNWRFAGYTIEESLSWGGLDCGKVIEVRVQAVPTYSDRPGEWSGVVRARVAEDVTPPSVPSKPTLTSDLGGVIIHWDGLNESGGGMEADFDHLVISRGVSVGSMTVIDAEATGKGDWLDFSGLTPGVEYFYAIAAVDHAGNQSDWSEAASVTVVSAVSQEQVDQIREDLDQARDDLDQAQSDLTEAGSRLDGLDESLEQTGETLEQTGATLDQATQDITQLQGKTDEVSQQAAKAIEDALNAQKTADGRNRIYRDWQDPRVTDPTLVPVQGDLWYRYQRYWTTSLGEPDNSPSALANFYTYAQGEPDNSPSVLVPLESEIVEVLMWDGSRWSAYTLVASNVVAPGSVVAGNLAAGSVSADKILAGAVTTEKLAALVVTADKLAANAVTADKIAANSVSSDKIVANAVTTGKLAALAVTADKLAANAVTAGKIAANAVTTDKIAANSVTGVKIAARTITADRIAAGAITSYELKAGAVTADKIAAGAITANKLAADAITGKTITGCTITGGTLTSTNGSYRVSIQNGRISGNGGYINFVSSTYGDRLHIHGTTLYVSAPSLWLNAAVYGNVDGSDTGPMSGQRLPTGLSHVVTKITSDSSGLISWNTGPLSIWEGHALQIP